MDWERARRLAKARAQGPTGMCEGCGKWGMPLDPHHRQARGAGGVYGAAAETANDVRNILALCRPCHDETEHAESWAATQGIGWRIPKFVADPTEIPALIFTVNGYGWHFLTKDVGYLWMDPETPPALAGATWWVAPPDPLAAPGSPRGGSANRLRLTFST